MSVKLFLMKHSKFDNIKLNRLITENAGRLIESNILYIQDSE